MLIKPKRFNTTIPSFNSDSATETIDFKLNCVNFNYAIS